jgi:transposase, IS5 family
VAIAALIPFETFRPKLNAALIKGELRRSEAEGKNSAGRKPWDEVVIFEALVLQALYNLSEVVPGFRTGAKLEGGRSVC